MKLHLATPVALAALTLAFAAVAADPRTPADPQAESIVAGSAVTNDELAALANEVNLAAWTQAASSRDFTTIDETWVSVYSPKDPVGEARNWTPQVAAARALAASATKAGHKRWLDLFIKAGEAVARNDGIQFVAAVRALETGSAGARLAVVTN